MVTTLGAVEYARCGELSIAYRVIGASSTGPDLLIVPSFVAHLDAYWGSAIMQRWLSDLASFSRVVLFDKAGTGLSDPVTQVPGIEHRVEEIRAVMDAADARRPIVAGLSEGGGAALALAAMYPELVHSLIIYGSFAHAFGLEWTDGELPSIDVMRAQLQRSDTPQQYRPNDDQLTRLHEFCDAVAHRWGTGSALKVLMPHAGTSMELATLERSSASPGMALAALRSIFAIDVRPWLKGVRCPTLIIHARGDMVPVQGARYMAAQLPDAHLIEVEGSDHAPWISDPERTRGEVERFVTGRREATNLSRQVTTILFTDIVDSTRRAAAVGDEEWRLVIQRHDATSDRVITSNGGQVIKSMGDGILAGFPGPAAAIGATLELVAQLAEVGIDVRAGIHTGECEWLVPTDDRAGDVRGMAVNIAARISALAGAGQVLVSRTVRDLVIGSGIGFADHGTHQLKGVPGDWTLLQVTPDGPAPGSVEHAIGSIPTPPAADNMRRGDRVVLAAMRRAPRVMRAVGRVTSRVDAGGRRR